MEIKNQYICEYIYVNFNFRMLLSDIEMRFETPDYLL